MRCQHRGDFTAVERFTVGGRNFAQSRASFGECEALAGRRGASKWHESLSEPWLGLQGWNLPYPFVGHDHTHAMPALREFDRGFEKVGERQSTEFF